MPELISTREAYGLALAELGDKYAFWVLDADLSKATRTEIFAAKYPNRFFDMGISESDMMSTAAGIASCGKTVFASTFAMFSAGRAYEQIRNSVAYASLNVKIGATHGGVLIGEDGGSHQCIEDIALMRVIPNMTVMVPADAVEARAVVEAAILHDGPVYMRFGKSDVPLVYNKDDFSFELGKAKQIQDGEDVTIIAAGEMVYESMVASEQIAKKGISARVIDMHTIKPIDREIIIKAAMETGCIVTVEDHNIIGGLGGAVTEVLSESVPVPVKRVGIQDRFGFSGKRTDLARSFGLDAKTIMENILAVINMKKYR